MAAMTYRTRPRMCLALHVKPELHRVSTHTAITSIVPGWPRAFIVEGSEARAVRLLGGSAVDNQGQQFHLEPSPLTLRHAATDVYCHTQRGGATAFVLSH